jgi:hypothetical protein
MVPNVATGNVILVVVLVSVSLLVTRVLVVTKGAEDDILVAAGVESVLNVCSGVSVDGSSGDGNANVVGTGDVGEVEELSVVFESSLVVELVLVSGCSSSSSSDEMLNLIDGLRPLHLLGLEGPCSISCMY